MYAKIAFGVMVAGLVLLIVLLLRPAPKRADIPAPQPIALTPPGDLGGAALPGHTTSAQKMPIDTSKPSPHGSGIDRKLAQITAMMKAPEGKTPCETAWNATQAEQEAAKQLGKRSLFLRVAEQGEFMRLCNALPKEAQPCMAPRYMAENRQKCLPHRPSPEVLRAMFEMRPDKVEEPDDIEKSVPGGAPLDGGLGLPTH
jgi:hypothetical protein